jgi:hypothetical protein
MGGSDEGIIYRANILSAHNFAAVEKRKCCLQVMVLGAASGLSSDISGCTRGIVSAIKCDIVQERHQKQS